jgi:hypothetical protein
MLGVLALGSAIALVVALSLRRADSAGRCVVVSGPAMLPEVPEASGLTTSRRSPGVLWSHNDSGNDAILFAIDATGAVRGRVRVPVRTRDWEDVSAGACPAGDCLYVADVGDNERSRPRIFIYRVAEPLPTDAEARLSDVFEATYADGPHNAESLFIIGDDLFIVTKDRTGGVYRARMSSPDSGRLVFRRVGEVGLAAVTDAETSADGRFVVVRTSHEAVLYQSADVLNGVFVPYLRIPIDGLREVQGEAVALDGTMLHLASEGRPWRRAGSLLTLRCDMFPDSPEPSR